MYLDTLPLQRSSVGYGQLGTHGSLGYEGKAVQVRRQHYKHALSTHPPAPLLKALLHSDCTGNVPVESVVLADAP